MLPGGALRPAHRVKFLPGWGTKIFTRPSRARAWFTRPNAMRMFTRPSATRAFTRKSAATADVYPAEYSEDVVVVVGNTGRRLRCSRMPDEAGGYGSAGGRGPKKSLSLHKGWSL